MQDLAFEVLSNQQSGLYNSAFPQADALSVGSPPLPVGSELVVLQDG